jgi:ketosteroid isomerase-like protein
MPSKLAERLRPTLAEWERGNFAAGGEIISSDVLLSFFSPEGMIASRGVDKVAGRLREIFEQWGDYRIEVDDLDELEDSVVLMSGKQHGLGKRSGIRIDDSLYVVFRFEDDLITEMYWHIERSEALRAAGVSA